MNSEFSIYVNVKPFGITRATIFLHVFLLNVSPLGGFNQLETRFTY